MFLLAIKEFDCMNHIVELHFCHNVRIWEIIYKMIVKRSHFRFMTRRLTMELICCIVDKVET